MFTTAQLVERQARLHRDVVFLTFEDEAITFGALLTRVQSAAECFRRAGLAAGDRVMVMMGNRPDHVVAWLALNWIGAVVVETSIHLKTAGIALQLEDADPRCILIDAHHAPDMLAAIGKTGRNVPVMTLAPCDVAGVMRIDLAAGDPARGEPEDASLDRIQAISYTSGTTGRPKGVVLNEKFFQIGAKNAALLADVRDDDVMFLWEPFYHVAAWMTVLIGLQRGVRIALVERFSGSQAWTQIRETGSTLFHYLGGAMNILLAQPEKPDDRDNPVRIAWGAAAPERSWAEFERRFAVTIREGYGISEAGNFTHLNLDGRRGSIGKPVEEFDCWIADEDGMKLPPRKVGEIVARPKLPGITMVGYFRDPERTREALRDGCVWTGDLGWMDEDGFFYYAGRRKDSLRRRGENVSAWEVERVLNAHPAVEESAVVGVASAMGEQEIRAFVQLAPGEHVEPLDLVKWCERDLAYYQIPRFFDFVRAFPRGPTQRIRKGDLRQGLEGSWDLETSGYKLRR